MPLLTPTELAAMQATQSQTLPIPATIKRKQATSDGAGGQTITEATVATTLCDFAKPRGQTRLEGDQQHVLFDYRFTFAFNEDVLTGDYVYVGSRKFELVQVYSFAWDTAKRADARETL